MARYEHGINGRFHGKIGPTVGCTWKGINYMRSLPGPPTKPPTKAQIANRAAFAFLKHWLDPIGDLVRVGFNDYSPTMTGRMAAHSYNYHNALKGEYPDFEIDYSAARFSVGIRPGVINLKTELKKEENTLIVTWDLDPKGKNSQIGDIVMLTAYSPDCKTAWHTIGNAIRSSKRVEMEIPENFINGRIEVMIAFKSLLGSDVSTSQYAGRIN